MTLETVRVFPSPLKLVSTIAKNKQGSPPGPPWPKFNGLPAQLELLRHRLVPAHVRLLQIIQQPPALAYHLQQTTPGTVVFIVGLQVLGQMINPLSQQGN